MFTSDDARAVVERVPDERGGGQRGVRHEQAHGVGDQVARVHGDAELGKRGVYEERGGQERGAHDEIRAVQYLAELERLGGRGRLQATGQQHVRVPRAVRRRRRRGRLGRRVVRHHEHGVHAVLVPLDGHQAVVHLHPAVRQQPVVDGRVARRFVQNVPAPVPAVRRLHPEEIVVIACRKQRNYVVRFVVTAATAGTRPGGLVSWARLRRGRCIQQLYRFPNENAPGGRRKPVETSARPFLSFCDWSPTTNYRTITRSVVIECCPAVDDGAQRGAFSFEKLYR